MSQKHLPSPAIAALVLLGAFLLPAPSLGQSALDALDEALTIAPPDSAFRADLSVLADLEFYASDLPAPGLIFPGDDTFLNPRLALFLDIQATDHLRFHGQIRLDRGFDPGSKPDGDIRLDEAALSLRPFGDDRLSIQAGIFPTVAGNWVPRHLSWQNPFINAPLPYEDVLTITDQGAPASPTAFLNRRNLADKKSEWVPIIWGPSYASGLAVSGRLNWLDYAAEIKNASLSSRPGAWNPSGADFDHPTATARLGVRPSPEWAFGTSFSEGPYLIGDPADTLPQGRSISDFDQTTFALDAAYQHHHWQFWAEVFHSTFEVPRVGDADITAYYLEAKYKLTPRLFAALRWNQAFSGKVPDGLGRGADWERDAWRADLALGFRFSEHIQAKIQFSHGDKSGSDQEGDNLLATQLTLRF